jgi:iron complex outermembrane recepter protein
LKSILLAAQFRLLILSVCLSLSFAAASVPLRAQQNASGTISGTVLDPDGNAVQNAVVAVRSESSVAVTKAVTDPQGKFSVAGLPAGSYTVEVSVPGFALAVRTGVRAGGEQTAELSISLTLGSVSDAITVEANASGSLAAQHAPMDGLLEARSARTEVTLAFIQNFVSPVADFGELIEMAPGTFSISSNGIGLGQDKTYFRGFPDGDYDIDFDGVPFYDTNSPHSSLLGFLPGALGRQRGL